MQRRKKLLISVVVIAAVIAAGVIRLAVLDPGLRTTGCWLGMVVNISIWQYRQIFLLHDLRKTDEVIVRRGSVWQSGNTSDVLKTIIAQPEIAELVDSVRLYGSGGCCLCSSSDLRLEFYARSKALHCLELHNNGYFLVVDESDNAYINPELRDWLRDFIKTEHLNPTNIFSEIRRKIAREQCVLCQSNAVALAVATQKFFGESGSATNASMADLVPRYIAQEPVCPVADGKRYGWSDDFGRFVCPVAGHEMVRELDYRK